MCQFDGPDRFAASTAEGFLLLLDFSHAISSSLLNLLAQEAAAAPAPPQSGIGAILNNPFFPLIGLFVLFYFIFILPERRRKADEAKMMSSLKKNDRIVTIGGIHGMIVAAPADSDIVTVKIDESGNTRVKLNRSAIARVVTDADNKTSDSQSKSND